MPSLYDAIIIGAGHNGLTCACYLAKAGLRVLVLEANENIGGLTITQEITLPDFHSDLHAFGYQFANLSPAPDELGLDRHGLELLTPEISFAHAFPDGRTVRMYKDVEKTCESIGARPIPELGRYCTPIPNVYLCGSSSHPGPGVSFMPGRNAAQVIFGHLELDFRSVVSGR